MARPLIAALMFLLVVPLTACAQNGPYQRLDPDAYQSFVGNWKPSNQPFCAVIVSAAQWNGIMHPAPVMGTNRPFGPPGSFWSQHGVLLLARVMSAGDTDRVFRITGFRRTPQQIDLRYTYTPPPKTWSTIKWWMALAVRKPIPNEARFIENGRTVCTTHAAASSPR